MIQHFYWIFTNGFVHRRERERERWREINKYINISIYIYNLLIWFHQAAPSSSVSQNTAARPSANAHRARGGWLREEAAEPKYGPWPKWSRPVKCDGQTFSYEVGNEKGQKPWNRCGWIKWWSGIYSAVGWNNWNRHSMWYLLPVVNGFWKCILLIFLYKPL